MLQCRFAESTALEAEPESIRAPKPDRDCRATTDLSGRIVGETRLLRISESRRCADMSMSI